MFPALAGCTFNYCWVLYLEVQEVPLRGLQQRFQARIPGVTVSAASPFTGSIPHPGTWHVRCSQNRHQASLGTFSTLTCVSAMGKAQAEKKKNLRLNLQLPLITHATKFIRSPCPFELWYGIFHAKSCFSGEKETFPCRFVGVFVE